MKISFIFYPKQISTYLHNFLIPFFSSNILIAPGVFSLDQEQPAIHVRVNLFIHSEVFKFVSYLAIEIHSELQSEE